MRLVPALLAVALAAPAAHAATLATVQPAPHGVAAAFGNTVKALYPDGRYERLWLNADGTWQAVGRSGKSTSGTWSLKTDTRVCLKQSKPFPAPLKYCTEFPAQGDPNAAWRSKDMWGEPIEVTVVHGIQPPQHGAGS